MSATAVVRDFFVEHRAHDTAGMAELCAAGATFDYIPFVAHDKQRKVTGNGYVNGVGRTIWALGFRAFPDASNEVHDVFATDDGSVVAEVTVTGTQAAPYLTLAPRGQSFSERHLFRFHVNGDGKIDDIAAYWNAGGMNAQLGHIELG